MKENKSALKIKSSNPPNKERLEKIIKNLTLFIQENYYS